MAKSYSKEEHRALMLEYLARDVATAKQHSFILGIKVFGRGDVRCPLKKQFIGVYLPDELPDLYPVDCPAEDACCCVLRENVFDTDRTEAASILRKIMLRSGIMPPEPSANENPLTSIEEAEIVAMARQAIQVLPKEKRPLWRFVLEIFGKKS